MTDLLALTEQLCAVPSVSGDEAALADLVEARLRERAPELEVDAARRQRRRAHAARRRDARSCSAAISTRCPANDNATPRRDGDTLHGLGSADMKGGLAVMLELAEPCSERRGAPRRDASCSTRARRSPTSTTGCAACSPSAPISSPAISRSCSSPPAAGSRPDARGRSTSGRRSTAPVRTRRGRGWASTRCTGPRRLLARIAAHEAPTVTVDGLAYRESLQVVRVEGRHRQQRRARPLRDHREPAVRAGVLVRRSARADPGAVRRRRRDRDRRARRRPAPPNLTHPLIAELVGDGDLGVRPKLGWTDVARFTQHGIAAVNFGPGDPELAHTAEERVERADLEQCRRVLSTFVGSRVERRAR